MKKPSDNLDFIKPIENPERESLTDAEKMEAAYKLSALVNDLLLRFADSVYVYKFDYPGSNNGRESSLGLRLPLGDDDELTAWVGSYSNDKEDMRKYITLDNGRYRYHMESQDEVLRYDLNTGAVESAAPLPSHIRVFGELGDTSGDNLKSRLEDNMARLENDMKNQQLEKQLGVNDQPVDPDEIDKLAQLLEGAEAIGAI